MKYLLIATLFLISTPAIAECQITGHNTLLGLYTKQNKEELKRQTIRGALNSKRDRTVIYGEHCISNDPNQDIFIEFHYAIDKESNPNTNYWIGQNENGKEIGIGIYWKK